MLLARLLQLFSFAWLRWQPAQRQGRKTWQPRFEHLEGRAMLTMLAPVNYAIGTVGTSAHSVVAGDVNNDGKVDLVAANYAANGSVSVLKGNGDGTFQAKSDFAAGAYAYDVALADFNGDGVKDIAVANMAGTSLASLLLGNGDGTFSAPVSIAAGTGSRNIKAADLNHDGKMDLVTLNSAGTFSVILGNGDGTFQPRTDIAAGISPNDLALADFNHDGNVDLVTANTLSAGTITVVLGNGDGTFQASHSYNAFSAPFGVTVGDFNHDGYDDVVSPNSYTSSAVSVMLGYGDGTFQAPTTYNIPSAPFSVEVGDFNGDGLQDLAERGNNVYEIQLGKGDGTFYGPAEYAAPVGPNDTGAVGDFNGDGSDDLAGATYTGTVAVVMNAANDKASLSTATGYTVSMPASVQANSPLAMTVSAVDAAGNVVTTFLGTVYISTGDPAARGQTVAYTFTAADAGTHVFTRTVALSTVGTQTVTVATPFLAPSTNSVNVTPQVTRFTLVAPANVSAGTPFTVTVSATDYLGNVGLAYTGTVHFSSTDIQAGLPATYTFTAADAGVANFTVTLKTAGARWLAVSDTAFISGGAYVSVAPLGASVLTVTGGAGPVGLARNVTAYAQDIYGNTATGYNGTLHFTSSDPLAILPPDAVAVNGVVTVPVTLMTPGAQTITATDVNDPTFFGVDIGVQAAPATMELSALQATTAGVAQSFTVTVKNTLGKIATDYTGSVYFSSSDAQAGLPASYMFTAADAGMHTFSVALKTAGSQWIAVSDIYNYTVSGSQTGIQVSAASAASYSVTGLADSVAGTAQNITVTVRDAFGNLASNYRGTVNFSSSDAQAGLPAAYAFTAADAGVHTFAVTLKTAGNQTINVQDAALASVVGVSYQAKIVAGTASTFLLNPPSNVAAGTAFVLKVTVVDAFGNVVKNYTGKIHFSNSAGTTGLPLDYTFTAADNGVQTFTVTLANSGVQTLSVADTLSPLVKASISINAGTKASGGGGSGGGGGGSTTTTTTPPTTTTTTPPTTTTTTPPTTTTTTPPTTTTTTPPTTTTTTPPTGGTTTTTPSGGGKTTTSGGGKKTP